MGRIIQVTPEQLKITANSIEGLAGDYKELYDQFYSETDAMTSTWSGKDNLAYITQIEGFKDDFDNMYRLMLQYVEFLRNSAEAYKTTQDAVANEARKLVN